MPNQSIVFSPELDERQLSKETKKVNQELNQSTQGISPGFDSSGMDSLRPAGSRGGGMGASGAMGAGALASKLPKPIAGVGVAAAVPVALGGAVGAGMLSAMHSASGHMQTSSSLLGIAADNFFREPGRIFDEFIYRPLSEDILSISLAFDEAVRDLSSTISDGIIPDSLSSFDSRLSATVDILDLMPGMVGDLVDAGQWASDTLGGIPTFTWPEISTPDWPTFTESGVLGSMDWPTLTLDAVLEYLTTDKDSGSGSSYEDYGSVTRDRPGDPTSGTSSGSGSSVSGPGQNSSTGTGGESRFTPGSGGSARMPEVETRLDETNKNLRDLKDAMHNMGIEVDGETLGRVTDDAQRNRIAGNDPTVL